MSDFDPWAVTKIEFEVDPAIWLTDKLRAIKVWFLRLRNDILTAVREWLAENNNWLKLLIITVISAVAVTAVSILGVYLGTVATQRTLLGTLKNLTAVQTLTLMLQVARGTWSILVQIDERLQALQIAFVGAWEEVGKAIGLPIGFAASFFTSYRALVFSLGAIAGYSPEELRLDWLTNINETLNTIYNDLDKYAYNPGLIFDYLITLPLRYDEGKVSDKTAAELEVLIQNTEDIGSLGENLQAVRDAIKGLQESLPDEIETAVADQTVIIFTKMDEIIDPISEALTRFEDILLPALEMLLTDTETRLQDQIDVQKLSLTEIAETLGFDITDPEERLAFMQHYFGEMIEGDMFGAIPLMHMSGVGWLGETEGNADPHDIFRRADLQIIRGAGPTIETLSSNAWYTIIRSNQYSEVNPWHV